MGKGKMKVLTIHSDMLEVEPKQKAIKDAEELKVLKQSFGECLVVFTAFEQRDETDPDKVLRGGTEEIIRVADEIGIKKIVLYPYVHLTNAPASAGTAKKLLIELQEFLRKDGYDVDHAPFGWYKGFTLKCKGHPLSELSREIAPELVQTESGSKAEDVISGALKAEEEIKSEWFILDTTGKLSPVSQFNFAKYPKLDKFVKYEISKVRSVLGEPPHVKLMKELELVDYEAGTDPGNFKYYPKGRLIKSLLEQWVTQKVVGYGAMEVETPIMYDLEHPALKSYLHRFPARQYIVQSAKKKFFLRFSACFGQFLTAANTNISYKDLPMKIYELTRYSFRLEKAGELVGLRRLRSFTMPDMHTICKPEQTNQEFMNQFKLCIACMEDLGFHVEDYETAIRFTKDFWDENKNFVIELVNILGKPVLIEMWNRRYAYFDPKFEFNFIDAMDKASALATVQIDHENGERFNIKYTDAENIQKYPKILHCSPSGAIERVIYGMLEKAWLDDKAMKENKGGKPAMLPLWLAPIQVRLCPMNDSFVEYAKELADYLEEANIRVDIDDRSETIQRKIRAAELEWIPAIVVIGEKEKSTGKLATRLREKKGKIETFTLEQLMENIKSKVKGKPFIPLPLPRELSKRPIFVGSR